MSHEGYRRAARACVAVVIFGALLVAAPAAWAGRISYNVLPGSGYTVKHEGRNGIVKVTYDTCLAAGQPTSFPLVVTASASGPVSPKVMKELGPGSIRFDPASANLVSGQAQAFTVTLIPAGAAHGGGPAYRFKLAAAPGHGLGEGPGVMVRIACVLRPGVSCPPGARTAARPAGHGDEHGRDQNDLAEPGKSDADEEAAANAEGPACAATPSGGCPPASPGAPTTAPTPGASGRPGSKGSGPGSKGSGAPGGPSAKSRGHHSHAARKGGNRGNGGNGGNGRGRGNAATPPPAAATGCPVVLSPSAASQPLAAPTIGRFGVLNSRETAAPARCVATPKHMRVHAGETTAIRVRVSASSVGIRRALVRVIFPGGRVIRRTGAGGVAVFHIRPTRTGRVTIQSDVCFGATRSKVLAFRRSGRVAAPVFTG
ncbi:MAG: hypothetical protein E6G56_01055 [Actinobacteria bacterium]|nr:MAG: hypothetical protein E6G56_01055 [Actinomycetota bacterium]